MPQTMTFTKFGHSITFDVPLPHEALPNTLEYGYFYGMRQSIQDAYANAKTPAEMEGDCTKKFEKIVSGNLRFRFDGASPRKSDLDEMIERLATKEVEAIATARGDKLSKAGLAEKVAFRITVAKDRLTEKAEALIAEEVRAAAELLDGATDVDYDV